MSYAQDRAQEQLRLMGAGMDAFVGAYRPGRPTVVLLPGGMASQLTRATSPHPNGPVPQGGFDYSRVWLDAEIMAGDALALRMDGDVDLDQRFICAEREFEILGFGPYSRFLGWCELHCYNSLVFAWDWRRRPEHAAGFLSGALLPALRARVRQAHGEDLADHLTLVGHSFGGLVLKLFLQRGGEFVDRLATAVTVGTPFYGYGGQVHRFFGGEPYLNGFYGRTAMARVVASMLGPYGLMFLDVPTFERDRAALAADPEYPLSDYPSVDADSGARADPYNPGGCGQGLFRYPQAAWFKAGELGPAAATRAEIAAPLPEAVAAKFHNIRGVQAGADRTVVAQTWRCVPAGFDPDADGDPDGAQYPIQDRLGPGDDTIPAWSARLVSTPAGNIWTLKGGIEHAFLMGHNETLGVLRGLVSPGRTVLEAGKLELALGPLVTDAAEPREVFRALELRPALAEEGEPLANLARRGIDPRSLARRLQKDLFRRQPSQDEPRPAPRPPTQQGR